MEVTLKIGSLDVSGRLSQYKVTHEVSDQKGITTLDNVEHPFPLPDRAVVEFSLFPMTEAESGALYAALAPKVVTATFSDPCTGEASVKQMRLTTSLESAFALMIVDGKRRYKGGSIQLRAV